ncbi:MAG: hypothetical protein HY659_12835 [Rhizobiales bacterium]|nr:hypothetical protein [Hyphomicrobiales bacterium]
MRKSRSRSKKATRRRGDTFAILLTSGAVIGLLALGVFVNAGVRGPGNWDRESIDAFEKLMRTGSILFVPPRGNDCRQKMIDNVTGLTWDVGLVDCDKAVAQAQKNYQRQWITQRVEEIRAGLAKR